MKKIRKVGNPTCDFCGEVARYDCPTNQGPWAHLCKACFKHYTTPARASIGFEFMEEPRFEGKSEPIKQLLEAMAPFKSGCATCGSRHINPEDFKDDLSKKEFKISGMCQKCQDSVFEAEEE